MDIHEVNDGLRRDQRLHDSNDARSAEVDAFDVHKYEAFLGRTLLDMSKERPESVFTIHD